MRTTTRAVLPLLAATLLGGGCDAPTEPTELEVTLTASPDPGRASLLGEMFRAPGRA